VIPVRKTLPLPSLPAQERNRKTAKKNRPRRVLNLVKRAVLLLGVVGLLAGAVVHRHAQIAVGEHRVARLVAEISELEIQKARLQVVALELSSLPRIERVARQELGMTNPKEPQILRVGVQGGN